MHAHTIRTTIATLGGSRAVADHLAEATGKRITDAAVRQWARSGHVPSRWVRIIAELSGVPPDSLSDRW